MPLSLNQKKIIRPANCCTAQMSQLVAVDDVRAPCSCPQLLRDQRAPNRSMTQAD
ncbi:hypothetical protein EGR_02023 [Echinococcus granulosus]|uniref:Uncharacterized protein n=1 Tax=Echinococcus granulosus TaxID=6210 RepID=W6V9E1_ECHGR|nr:hypothetical protein EGR_02023 [Echinococcus granulosus]EUB63219.1 hypothetical protein EGR_02023 [Echinococcus granulosus]